jgi:DnaJ-class molecular chaperone
MPKKWISMADVRVCPDCNGVGRVEGEDGHWEVCSHCHGAGFINEQDEQPTVREPDSG